MTPPDIGASFEPSHASFDVLNWALRVSLALYFLDAGLEKFSNDPHSMWLRVFQQIGVGDWLRYLTGILESGGGVALLAPPLSVLAVAALGTAMIGAMAFHIVLRHDPASALIPAGLLAAVVATGWKRLAALASRARPGARTPSNNQ